MVDFNTDLHSINHIVKHAKSKKGAERTLKSMHGISVPEHVARIMLRDAVEKKFPSQQEAQASYVDKIKTHYE